MQTEDVFMECVDELKEQFGKMPTATQLSAATGLTVAVCEQVLSDLELLLPRSLAGSEPVLPSLQLPRVPLLRSLRLRLLPISPVIRRKIVRINAKSKVLCAQSLLELTLDDTIQDDDDATQHHPSPGFAPPPEAVHENGESEMEDDDPEVVPSAVPHKPLPDRQSASQETPLAASKRQLSFEDAGSKKPKALRNVCFRGGGAHLTCSHSMTYHVKSCHAMPRRAKACHAVPCHAMPKHAMPCHAMPWFIFLR